MSIRHLAPWYVWVSGGALLIAALLVFVVPSPLARYLISSQLNALDIKHEGLGSVDVDLWNRGFSAGPIQFSGGEGEPARVGSVNAVYSISNFLEKRAFIESFTISGVSIFARRKQDGTISINGVSPQDLARDNDADDPDEDDAEFGYGVSTFVFTDSELVLEDVTGGRLALMLTRLELKDFQSWEPNSPGQYDLTATLNGMKIRAIGEATPFAETINVNGDLSFSGLTLDGVAAFVGPTGLTRQNGTHALNIKHKASLSPDGAIRTTIDGTALTENADIATSEGETLTVALVENTFNAEVSVHADNSIDISGAASAKLRQLDLTGADASKLTLAGLNVALTDMSLRQSAELRPGVTFEPDAGSVSSTDADRAASLVQLALRGLISVGQEVLRHKLDGSMTAAVSATGAQATAPDGSAIALDAGEITTGEMLLETEGEDWKLSAPVSASLNALSASAAGSDLRIGQLSAKIDALRGVTDFIDRALDFDLALNIKNLSATSDEAKATAAVAAFQSKRLAFAGRNGTETLKTTGKLEIQSLKAGMAGASPVEASAKALALVLDAFAYDEASRAAVITGDLKVMNPAARSADMGAGVGELQVAMRNLSANLSPEIAIAGAADVSGSDFRFEDRQNGLKATLGGLEAKAESLRHSPYETAITGSVSLNNAAAATADMDAGASELRIAMHNLAASLAPEIKIGGAADISGLDLRFEDRGNGLTATLGSLDATADGLRHSPDETAVTGSISLTNATAKITEGVQATVKLGAAEATGMDVVATAGALSRAGIDSIALTGLDAEAAIAVFGDDTPAATGEPTLAKDLPSIRIGQFTIVPGGQVVVTDSSAGDALRLPVGINRFDIGAFDTAAPAAQTPIDVDVKIGDAATAKLAGTAALMGEPVEFDLDANLANFPLPLVSPYITKFIGLTVESGALDVTATGKAPGGALAGQVDVKLADFHVAPPNEATAARFRKDFGVSVGLAVGVLKDSDGVIQLSLPVSGAVDAPVVDYSAVISKAIGGAIASLFPNSAVKGEAGFSIDPVPFDPGADALSDTGKAAADKIVAALAAKPEIRLRVCGKGARADLLAIRGPATKPAPSTAGATPPTAKPAEGATPAPVPAPVPAPAKALEANDAEAQALIALAQARGGAIRAYFEAQGIAAKRVGECRTSYSVESDASPRADVQF